MEKNKWVILLIAFIIVLAGVWFIPQWDHALFQSDGPGALTVLGVGLLTSGFAALCIYLFAREHQLTTKFIALAIAYNILLVVAKFVAGPLSLYDANRKAPFSTASFAGTTLDVLVAALGVLLLYLVVLLVIYQIHKRMARDTDNPMVGDTGKTLLRWISAWLALGLIIVIGGVAFILLVFPAAGYLSYVLTTAIGIAIAFAIIIAATLLSETFSTLRELTKVSRDTSILAAFFWVAASIIFIFHALWVVYMLAIVAAWPLRTVTPK